MDGQKKPDDEVRRGAGGKPGLSALHVPDAAAWRAWLKEHHADSPGVWLLIARKGAAQGSVSYDEALDEALCFGWIDGQKGSHDDSAWRQKFTPRGPRSVWSKRNRARAEALIASGRMTPAGAAAVELAKADGRWAAAYDSPSTAAVPDDLQAELDAHPEAKAFFATLDAANRYAILWRLQTAKKPETRARRLAQFVGMLERHEVLHPSASR
jgi:uncharacterized protein YdeI (YjbR/CyaY-like superfamily)